MRTQGTGSKSSATTKKAEPRKAAPKAAPAKAAKAPAKTSARTLEKPPPSNRAVAREAKNDKALQNLKSGGRDGFGAHLCSPSCGHAAPGANRQQELVSSGKVPPRTAPASIKAGGFTIHTSGIGQPGIQESVNIAERLSQRADIAERLRKNKVDLVLLPHDKKLTDVPQFTQLRGKKTFDGRTWDGVRGVANVTQNNGRIAVALPEENLIELPSDPYGGNFSVGIHEVAHAVHGYGVTDKERKEILAAYNAQKKSGGAFTDAYASSNEYEYFAQATSAYLSRNVGQGEDGPGWVKKNDPRIYAILEKVYGPPSKFQSVDPKVTTKPQTPKQPEPKLPEPQLPPIDVKPPKVEIPKIEVPPIELPKIETPSTRTPTSMVRRGSKGDDVKVLQNKLRAAGYLSGNADGIFGPQTDFAVRRYQKANNLKVDGIVGPATWKSLASVQG